MKNNILHFDLRSQGLSDYSEDLDCILACAASKLRIPIPRLIIQQNRNALRGIPPNDPFSISVPIRALERSKAFGIYAIVHQMVHLCCLESCDECGWRGAKHSDEFHKIESNVMKLFGVQMVYRALNHQCELQDLDGNHICDGLGQ